MTKDIVIMDPSIDTSIPDILNKKIEAGTEDLKVGKVHSFDPKSNHFLTATYVRNFIKLKPDDQSLAVKILMNIKEVSTETLKKAPEQDCFIVSVDAGNSIMFVAYIVSPNEQGEFLYSMIAVHSEPKEKPPTFH